MDEVFVHPLGFQVAGSPAGGVIALGGVAASALLFGVVYRYALRDDLGNAQLKAGVVGAFGLVRGIGQASEIVALSSANLRELPPPEALGLAALAMGESMLLFGFASVALELALARGLVKPLGGARRAAE
jgi:hypothetical protein